jgi:hypothetical protein
MASSSSPRIFGFKAGGDLSAKQFYGVVFGSADDTVVAAGAAVNAIGIVQNAPASGELAEVALQGGGAKAKLSGTVTRGSFLKTDANGAFEAATAGDKYAAMAMASGVSGDVIPVEVVYGELET